MPEWASALDEYSISYPFGGALKAIEVDEADVDDELLERCIEERIIPDVAEGYFITYQNIEKHLEVIKEHGMEAYLEKRLEKVDDE